METKRGFAAMTPERRAELGRIGGLAISQDRNHMAEISRKGHAARSAKKKE